MIIIKTNWTYVEFMKFPRNVLPSQIVRGFYLGTDFFVIVTLCLGTNANDKLEARTRLQIREETWSVLPQTIYIYIYIWIQVDHSAACKQKRWRLSPRRNRYDHGSGMKFRQNKVTLIIHPTARGQFEPLLLKHPIIMLITWYLHSFRKSCKVF